MALPKLTKEETIAIMRPLLQDGWSLHVAKKRAFVRPKYEREVLNKDPEYVQLVLPYRKVTPKNPKRQGIDTTLYVPPVCQELKLPVGANG